MSLRLRWVLLALLLWVAQAQPAAPSAAAGLDASYVQALGEALKHGLVFGEQLVFTYGPLGWFPSGAYDPELAWLRYVCVDVGLGLLLAGLLARAVLQQSGVWRQLVCVAVFALPDWGVDGRSFVLLLALLCALESLSVWLVAGVLGALAWTKFSMFPAACVVALTGSAQLWTRGERRRAVQLSAGFALALVSWWLVCGQPLAALPRFLARALELAGAYGGAMSLPGEPLLLWGSVLGALALFATRRWSWTCVGAALLVAVVWKACFVRPGPNQVAYFGLLACAAPLLPAGLAGWQQRAGALSAVALLVMASLWELSPRHWLLHARALFLPWQHFEQRAAEREQLRQAFALPAVRERVGREGVDVFSAETGVVFLNDLVWNPRPIFQAYSVWTAEQSRRNAERLLSPDGPRHVLHRLTTLDERLPGQEDFATLAVLLEHFEPKLVERGFTLFERREGPWKSAPRELLASGVLPAGEWLTLPPAADQPQILELEWEPRAWARLAPKLAPVWVEVESSDGQRVRWRILPELAAGGVLAAPLLTSDEEWWAWLSQEPARELRRLCVLGDQPVRYAVFRAPGLARARAAEFASAWRYAGLGLQPLRVQLPPGARPLLLGQRQSVLVVEAPSRITVETAGARRLAGAFGIWTHDHWSLPPAPIEFSIWQGEQQLWAARLDPGTRPKDQRLQRLSVELSPGVKELELRTLGPASGAYWSELRLEDR